MANASEETVVVRDREGLRRLTTDDWTATTLVAALSDDPRDFDELGRAWLRYRPEESLTALPWTAATSEAPMGAWLLLDLPCRRVAAGGGSETPENLASYQRDEGPSGRDNPVVWINLPPGWQRVESASRAEDGHMELPPLPAPAELLDVRGVLFGRAFSEGIARRTLAAARREPLPSQRIRGDDVDRGLPPTAAQREAASRWHELTVRVHADWLLTPRDDLDGEPPRSFLHRGRDWVDRELENRRRQWARDGRPPRPLDRDTFTYRHGPPGTHEVVMYFELCREVIDAAWDCLAEEPEIEFSVLSAVLQEYARTWLAEGSIDEEPTPPAAIIDHERRRMPLVGGEHLDDDCPLCRMQAEGGFGPSFWLYDGHQLELDDEFAFSLCETREQWEEQQRAYSCFREGPADEGAPRQQEEKEEDETFTSAWKNSFVDERALQRSGSSPVLITMALATRVAELVADLQTASPELVQPLNACFDAYRRVIDDPSQAAAARRRLAASLEQIASAAPSLTSKAADLQSTLDEYRRQQESSP